MSLILKVKNTTESPGVYLMKSKSGEILYVGKAKNLKKRLFSYFSKSMKTVKTQELVKRIVDYEVIMTLTESEALLLELNLIKKHQPKYNIKLKHGDSYPFIAINLKRNSPFFEIKYNNEDSAYTYFGPYPQRSLAYELVSVLNESFKLRTCKDNVFNHRSRPCILFQVGKCSAPCTKEITNEDYMARVGQAMATLTGKTSTFLKDLKTQMKTLAENQEFEKASEVRDLISKIKQIKEKQSVIFANSSQNRFIINLSREGQFYFIGLLEINNGKVVDLQTFPFEDYDQTPQVQEYIDNFIAQVFRDKPKVSITIPKEYDVNEDLEKALDLKISKVKPDDSHLMELILKNLVRQENVWTVEKLKEVQDQLKLEKFPEKIECIDISHFQGSYTVGSKVCLENGLPNKSEYRKYKIKKATKVDDYASLAELVERRFNHPEEKFPDLLIVDGGAGQLHAVVQKMEEMNIQGVEVVGLAKDRTKSGFQSEEIVQSGERIVKVSGEEILVEHRTSAYRLVTQARNEAHRFALKYHRQLRSKNFIKKS